MMKITHWHEYLITIGSAVLLSLFLRFFIISSYLIPTKSMEPNLLPGDFLLSFRNSLFLKHEIQRGDLIIFTKSTNSKKLLARRVIGLPGDKVEILHGCLILNGQNLQYGATGIKNTSQNARVLEVYTESAPEHEWKILKSDNSASSEIEKEHFGPIMVADNEYFVLADQRESVEDSRTLGLVNSSQIIGKIWLIWFSWGIDFGESKEQSSLSPSFQKSPGIRWNRIFKFAH